MVACATGSSLLEDGHPARSGEVARGKRIEIQTACDGLAECVFAIPIGGVRAVLIHASLLMSERYCPADGAAALPNIFATKMRS